MADAGVVETLTSESSYVIQQCTWWLAHWDSWIPANLGNAYQWLGNAQARGFETIGPTLSPPAGAIAVWDSGLPGSGGNGHVAEVLGSAVGGFKVREGNFSIPFQPDERTVTSLEHLAGFILPAGVHAGAGAGSSSSSSSSSSKNCSLLDLGCWLQDVEGLLARAIWLWVALVLIGFGILLLVAEEAVQTLKQVAPAAAAVAPEAAAA